MMQQTFYVLKRISPAHIMHWNASVLKQFLVSYDVKAWGLDTFFFQSI